MESSGYTNFLENFGSGIGSTLEDLATNFEESEYDFADDIPAAGFVIKDSRSSSFQSHVSMDSMPGIADWSLKKAKPLAFANPVYHLLTADKVAAEPRQMKLIPLNQFEINKNQEDTTKKSKKGIMNKLSNLTLRRSNSTKRSEPEMQVTAPLWTDAPTVIPSEPRIRSRSFIPNSKNERFEGISEAENENDENREKSRQPLKLDLESTKTSNDALKPPPIKTPRTSKGNFSPIEKPTEFFESDKKETRDFQDQEEVTQEREKVSGSSNSLASDDTEVTG